MAPSPTRLSVEAMAKSTAVCILLIVFMLATFASGQSSRGIWFGRTPGTVGSTPKAGMTYYTGRADHVQNDGPIATYRGNVRIFLPAANVVLHADEVVHNQESDELTFSGSVRLKLDSK